jgi:hypothetical protein
MIITQLNGGLGNQMFQYVLGRVLALKHNTDLHFDLSLFIKHQSHLTTKRQYELNPFNLPVKIATPDLVEKFRQSHTFKALINRYLSLNLNLSSDKYINESGQKFQPEILKLPDNIYLSGYWQTEKYFIDYRDQIIKDFSKRKSPVSLKNKQIKSGIENCHSVSVHIRRGDYITNKSAKAYHGTCSISYYQKAMKLIEKTVKNPKYYIFSDDPEWTKNNIKPEHQAIYISHNKGIDCHEDMRLMSRCKHNIIANSSFSWWGAWLNQNVKKIVIAPQQWFLNKSVNQKDIIPKKWIKI